MHFLCTWHYILKKTTFLGLPLGTLGPGDRTNPAFDHNLSPNAEATFVQPLLVTASMKSKDITINTNTLKQLFQGQTDGVQRGAFLVRERPGGTFRTGDDARRGPGDWGEA